MQQSVEKVWGTTAPTAMTTSLPTTPAKSPLPSVHHHASSISSSNTSHQLEPLPRAPENVFLLRDSQVCLLSSCFPFLEIDRQKAKQPFSPSAFHVHNIQGKHCGWRNTFNLPVSYDVEMIPGILDLQNDALAVRHIPTDLTRRRFIVIGKST